QCWNIPAYDVISGKEIVKLVREITGYKKKVGTVTKNMLGLVGSFNTQMRELVELQYVNETPVVLDGAKFAEHIASAPKTSYTEGLTKTIIAYQKGEELR